MVKLVEIYLRMKYSGTVSPHQNWTLHTSICRDWLRECARHFFRIHETLLPTFSGIVYQIKSKLCGLLSTGVLLQCNSAGPHNALTMVATIQDPTCKYHIHSPYCLMWLLLVWTTQRGNGRRDYQYWWRGPLGGSWVAVFVAMRNPYTVQLLWDLYHKQQLDLLLQVIIVYHFTQSPEGSYIKNNTALCHFNI